MDKKEIEINKNFGVGYTLEKIIVYGTSPIILVMFVGYHSTAPFSLRFDIGKKIFIDQMWDIPLGVKSEILEEIIDSILNAVCSDSDVG